jgi:hypothetical protein
MKAKQFYTGHTAESVPLKGKIENDLNLKPSRHIRVAANYGGKRLKDGKGFDSNKYSALNGLKLNPRREKPRFFISDKALGGYRVIYGVFDFDKALHGAVMLGPNGRVFHSWQISQAGVGWEHENDTNIFSHGFEIAQDGSIVTAYDHGTTLTKYDYCGNILWRLKGGFHHSITFEGPDAIWTWGDLESKAFGNNMHRGYSNIMEVNPVSYKHKIIVEGEKYNFYTWHRGKHQRMPDGESSLLHLSKEEFLKRIEKAISLLNSSTHMEIITSFWLYPRPDFLQKVFLRNYHNAKTDFFYLLICLFVAVDCPGIFGSRVGFRCIGSDTGFIHLHFFSHNWRLLVSLKTVYPEASQ